MFRDVRLNIRKQWNLRSTPAVWHAQVKDLRIVNEKSFTDDTSVKKNGSLIIKGTTSDDSGRYFCHVFNNFTSTMADVNLTVTGKSHRD